jgi:hypothetical protein
LIADGLVYAPARDLLRWLTRSGAVASLLLSAAAPLTVDSLPAAIQRRSESPVRLTAARVCPYESFSHRLNYCTQDKRGVPLRTNKVACSVTTVTNRPLTLHAQLRYDGSPVYTPSVRIPRGTRPWWFSYTVGANLPLPAGLWSCTFIFGPARTVIPFRTVGPTGDVVDLTVCAGRNTIGPLRNGICRMDESETGLTATNSLACSLFILHKVGSTAQVDILDPTGRILGAGKSQITSALWPAWAWTISGAPTFAAGTYSCQVTIDDKVVLTRPFSIAD